MLMMMMMMMNIIVNSVTQIETMMMTISQMQ